MAHTSSVNVTKLAYTSPGALPNGGTEDTARASRLPKKSGMTNQIQKQRPQALINPGMRVSTVIAVYQLILYEPYLGPFSPRQPIQRDK